MILRSLKTRALIDNSFRYTRNVQQTNSLHTHSNRVAHPCTCTLTSTSISTSNLFEAMARTKRRAQKSNGNDKPYNLRNGSSYYHGDGDKNSKQAKFSSRSDDEEAPDKGSDVRARHSETTRESSLGMPRGSRSGSRSGRGNRHAPGFEYDVLINSETTREGSSGIPRGSRSGSRSGRGNRHAPGFVYDDPINSETTREDSSGMPRGSRSGSRSGCGNRHAPGFEYDVPRKTASSTSEFKRPKKTTIADRSGEIGGYTNHTNRYARHTSSERYGGTGNRDHDHIASTSNFNDGDRYNNSGGDRYNNIGGGWYNNSDGDRYGTNGVDKCNNTDGDSDRYSDTRENGYYNSGGDRYNTAGIRKRAREDRGADHKRRQSHRTRNHSPDEQSPEPRGRGYDRGVVDSTVRKSINTSEKGHLISQNNSHQNINPETDHNLDAIELLGWAGHKPVLNHRLDSACGMKLVVLDLNGLLVHRTRGQNFFAHPNHKFIKNLQGKPQGVLIRPYVVEFIDFLFTHFHVAVWSSMMDKNVRSIMEVVFRPEDLERVYFLLHQGSCDVAKHPENKHKPLLIKDLHKVWRADAHFTKENTLLIDDSKLKARRNPSNLLFNPEEWVGDMEDTALSPEGGYIYTWMDGFSKWTGSVADYVKDQEKKGN